MTSASEREASRCFVFSSRFDARSSTAAAWLRQRALRNVRRGVALGGALLLGACGRIELGSRHLGSNRADGGELNLTPDLPRGIPPLSNDTAPGHAAIHLPPAASKPSPLVVPDAAGGDGSAGSVHGDAADDAGFDADVAPVLDPAPPSCRGATEFCGPSSDSCCLTLPAPGATVALPIDAAGTRAAVTVSSHQLDKYEVTVGRFRAFLADYDVWRAGGNPRQGAGSHPRAEGSGWQQSYDAYLPESAAAFETLVRECNTIPLSTLDLSNTSSRIPINCVTWIEASAFCAWDEARLPTFPEWYDAAAGGALDRIYPWGDEPTPSRLYALYGCALGLERPECNAAYVLPVGSHPNGAGLYQHEDLAGSMTEWLMGGSLDEFAAGCTDCVGLTPGPHRFWKSGSWVDDPTKLENTYFVIAELTLRLPFLGVRCARDAP